MLRYNFFQVPAIAVRTQSTVLRACRTYSSRSDSEEDYAVARTWFQSFDKSTIPTKIAETTFDRSSGPGGQKVNKTESKATTRWPFYALARHVPKVLHDGMKRSKYYKANSDSFLIQSDTGRDRNQNKDETYARLFEEIQKIYKTTVPGVTSEHTKKRIEALHSLQRQTSRCPQANANDSLNEYFTLTICFRCNLPKYTSPLFKKGQTI